MKKQTSEVKKQEGAMKKSDEKAQALEDSLPELREAITNANEKREVCNLFECIPSHP